MFVSVNIIRTFSRELEPADTGKRGVFWVPLEPNL